MNAGQRPSRYRRRRRAFWELQRRRKGKCSWRSRVWKYVRKWNMRVCEVNYHQAARIPYLMPNSTQVRATPHTSEMFLDPGFEFKCFESKHQSAIKTNRNEVKPLPGEWQIKGGATFMFRGCSFECDTKSRCRSRSRASWSVHSSSSSEGPSEMGMMQSSSSSFHAIVFEGATQH